ncbi:MAG: CaiB/BaiF CoA transferase family protein [Ectobacillus sp.]
MLKGITVLDFSHYLPGPYATLRLADLGAEVIKVEPLFGDLARGFDKQSQSLFAANNRNKKSISLNVKEREGKEAALKLIEKADVVVESFRPGVMKRLGLDYAEAKKYNNNIIYASVTGYGQQHEHSHLASHDLNFMAVSGVLAQLTGNNGAPVHPKITLGDEVGGMLTAEKIIAALFQRERTGIGCYLDISLTDSLTMLMNNHAMLYEQSGKGNGLDVLAGTVVSYAIYQTNDDRFVALAAVEKKFWENFCRYAERKDWIPLQQSPARAGNQTYEEVKAYFASKPYKYWRQVALEVDCCMTPVVQTGELASSPYTKHMLAEGGYIYTHSKPEVAAPPELGAQTKEILYQLGLSETEIVRLHERGIIGGVLI